MKLFDGEFVWHEKLSNEQLNYVLENLFDHLGVELHTYPGADRMQDFFIIQKKKDADE